MIYACRVLASHSPSFLDVVVLNDFFSLLSCDFIFGIVCLRFPLSPCIFFLLRTDFHDLFRFRVDFVACCCGFFFTSHSLFFVLYASYLLNVRFPHSLPVDSVHRFAAEAIGTKTSVNGLSIQFEPEQVGCCLSCRVSMVLWSSILCMVMFVHVYCACDSILFGLFAHVSGHVSCRCRWSMPLSMLGARRTCSSP